MNLIPWRRKQPTGADFAAPDHPLSTFRHDIDNVLDRFMRAPWGTGLTDMLSDTASIFPRLDMSENDHEVTVRAELPGVSSDDVTVEATGNLLTIRGQKSDERAEQRGSCHYSERCFGSFSRSVQLPTAVDASDVDARFKDGVLTVTLRKHPEASPKKIKVRNA